MRAADTRALTFDLDLGLDLDIGPPGLDRPRLGARTVRPRSAPPVVPPGRHQRRDQRVQPRSAPRPRPMRKPGGVR